VANIQKIMLIFVLLVADITLSTPSGYAVFGGDSALGDSRVVAVINGQYNLRSNCTGALITPQIVVTAAHCLGNKNFKYESEIYTPEDLWVSKPGVDIGKDDIKTRVQVLRAVLTAGFDNTFDGENLNFITQKDDITFLFLEKPLAEVSNALVADASEVSLIKSQQLFFTHIGYGYNSETQQDSKPYLVQLNSYSDGASRHLGASFLIEENTVSSRETGIKALCVGDSGSPWYANINGKEVIVAVTVTASGCHGSGSGISGTLGTVIHSYLYLVDTHWNKYLAELPRLREKLQAPLPNMELPLIQTSGGCHAYVKASLQTLRENDLVWVEIGDAQGWQRIESCPETNPYQPWVRAVVQDGAKIRWHIWQPGVWDYLSPVVIYAAPTPTPVPAATRLGAKSKTITCVKGTKTKKVSAAKRKCPKGYVKKS
jgi:hypothetical protein